MSKHTPTPWMIYKNSDRSNTGTPIYIHSESQVVQVSGTAIAAVYGSENSENLSKRADERDANAQHIVHCVNHHDELVAALEDIARTPEGDEDSAQAIARAILAKVKEAA